MNDLPNTAEAIHNSRVDSDLRIFDAASPEDIDAVRTLLREYTAYLATFIRPDQLSFEYRLTELENLPGDSTPPRGALLLGRLRGVPAGCIAFGPLKLDSGAEAAELRRMWVRPELRGHGIGRQLVSIAIARARAAGHSELYLENDPETMAAAAHLYSSFGFRKTPPQRNDHTLVHATFFRLDLRAASEVQPRLNETQPAP